MIFALIAVVISGFQEWQMEKKLKRLTTGDVIRFNRDGYKHQAIYIGKKAGAERSVIHWWTNDNTEEPRMRIDPFRIVYDKLCFDGIQIQNDQRNMDNVIQRAMAFMERVDNLRGERNHYNGLFKNSSHFVCWCLRGLGGIDINREEIMNVTDPWKFVYGTVTNRYIVDTDRTEYICNALKNLERGDVIRYFYQHYEHWALYVGNLEVIHWWDNDSLGEPILAIGEWDTVAGHCKAEIDWNNVLVDRDRAVHLAIDFITTVEEFPNIMRQFDDSRQFAFWCHFGLGTAPFQNLPPMATEEEAQNFVDERMLIGHPTVITRQHNDSVQAALSPGDIITFSQDSHQYFAMCIEKIRGVASLIWLTEVDGPVSCIKIDQFETVAKDRKAMIYTDRVNLEGAYEWDEMVKRAKALRTKVEKTEDDCTGLFANSMHFAMWVLDKYGTIKSHDVQITVKNIEGVEDVWQHVYEYRPSSKDAANKVQIRQRNKRVLDSLQEGDLVIFNRTIYLHYAVFAGRYAENCNQCRSIRPSRFTYAISCGHKGKNLKLGTAVPGALSVIHWWNDPTADFSFNNPPKASIRIDPFWTVVGYDLSAIGNDTNFENSDIDGHAVIKRAKQTQKRFKMGIAREITDRPYNLLRNNCEHFAYMCRYERHISKQVKRIDTFILAVLQIVRIAILYPNRSAD